MIYSMHIAISLDLVTFNDINCNPTEKLLKTLPDSPLEDLIFKTFLGGGGHVPDPPRLHTNVVIIP